MPSMAPNIFFTPCGNRPNHYGGIETFLSLCSFLFSAVTFVEIDLIITEGLRLVAGLDSGVTDRMWK